MLLLAQEDGVSISTDDEPVLRVVGRYQLLREVGRGGTAVVYVARQSDLGRLVALKELAAFQAAKPEVVERFLRESRVTGALNHPNVVTVHEYLEHESTAKVNELEAYITRKSDKDFAGKYQHGYGPLKQKIESLKVHRRAAIFRNEEHRRQSDGEADHGDLRSGESRRRELRGEGHETEESRRRGHEQQRAVRRRRFH